MAAPGFSARSISRTSEILRFRECQRRRRQWIGFWDIADWIACERGTTDRRDEGLRQQAYNDLLNSVLADEFERRGKSLVLHLSPHAQPGRGSLRLTTELLRSWIGYYAGTAMVVDQVMPRCWVPHGLARRWFERRAIKWPEVFNSSAALPEVPARRSNEKAEPLANAVANADRPTSESPASCKPPTASYLDVKDAVKKRGGTTEKELLKAAQKALPTKHIPRSLVRRARDDLFGKPGRTGRPKSLE